MRFRPAMTLCSSALLMVGCGSADKDSQPATEQAAPAATEALELPARIDINVPDSKPEGVEYDSKNRRFLVGSLSQGTVFVVGNDGSLTPFAQDADLKSSVGIEIDEARNRLLVANADLGVFENQSDGRAMLGIFDLDSGQRIAMIDLSTAGPKAAKRRFANDVTVGADGSVYVTDTIARVVYKVAPDNSVSLLAPKNIPATKNLAFNGIEFHPAGYLLVADAANGDLYKVALDKPSSFERVTLPEPVPAADGIVLRPDGTLYVLRSDDSRTLVALSSSDDWASATVVGRASFQVQATTTTVAEDAIYVVHPQFDDAQALPFIERVELN